MWAPEGGGVESRNGPRENLDGGKSVLPYIGNYRSTNRPPLSGVPVKRASRGEEKRRSGRVFREEGNERYEGRFDEGSGPRGHRAMDDIQHRTRDARIPYRSPVRRGERPGVTRPPDGQPPPPGGFICRGDWRWRQHGLISRKTWVRVPPPKPIPKAGRVRGQAAASQNFGERTVPSAGPGIGKSRPTFRGPRRTKNRTPRSLSESGRPRVAGGKSQ